SRLFPPIAGSLRHARPESVELDPSAAWSFLAGGAPALARAGFGVIVPGELTASGQRRLKLRMRVGSGARVAGAGEGTSGLAMDALLQVDWEAALGDRPLTARELAALARQKSPLVRFRGAWVAVDPDELAAIRARIARGPSRMSVREAMHAALAGEAQEGAPRATPPAMGPLPRGPPGGPGAGGEAPPPPAP